jgi:hypothetical protein
MDNEIKHPFPPFKNRPEFLEPAFDYRNKEDAGKFRGVGEAGKIGSHSSESPYAMPKEPMNMRVPRDHGG